MLEINFRKRRGMGKAIRVVSLSAVNAATCALPSGIFGINGAQAGISGFYLPGTIMRLAATLFPFVGLLAIAGCEQNALKPVQPSQAAHTPRPSVTYTPERISFAPTPIAAANVIGSVRPLVKSLLNVHNQMRYGNYVWNETGVRPGKAWILVDLAAQTISVFRDGNEIGRAVTLFGVDGHLTPTGRFTILERDKHHVSSVYDAPMPYTLRLTGDGISIHGSDVRAGMGTHGCVGVPLEFGSKLFEVMRVGDEVLIIADRTVHSPSVQATGAKFVG